MEIILYLSLPHINLCIVNMELLKQFTSKMIWDKVFAVDKDVKCLPIWLKYQQSLWDLHFEQYLKINFSRPSKAFMHQ